MKLSKRLDLVAKLIEKQTDKQDILADIGTDHGYLPCFLVSENKISKAYACDVAIGPLNSSKETIEMMHLEQFVTPLLGNGLEPILNKDCTVISICGMGGFLMQEILEAHLQDLPQVHTLVLQPNICEYVIREYLCTNGWYIEDEAIVKDVNHRYEVMVYKRGKKEYHHLDYIYGPILRQKQSSCFKEKWHHELLVRQKVIHSIQDHQHPKYQEVMQEIEEIKEILNED